MKFVRTIIACLITVLTAGQACAQESSYATAEDLDLQKLLTDAARQPNAVVQLPAGVHKVTAPVRVLDARNLTIEGKDTTLLFDKFERFAMTFEACHGVTLRGFTLDYSSLPFTQGTIVRKSDDGLTFDIQIHDGYPDIDKRFTPNRPHIFDGKTLAMKHGAAEQWSRTVDMANPRKPRLTVWEWCPGRELIGVGDMVAFTIRSAGALNFINSADARVEDVRILASPALGVHARAMDGDNRFRFTIERGPRPVGATVDRLLSLNADGINYADSRRGPTIEGCNFSFLADDAVNLHGLNLPIVAAEGNVLWATHLHGKYGFERLFMPGDPIRILAGDNFAMREELTIQSVEVGVAPPPGAPSVDEIIAGEPRSGGVNKDRVTWYRFTLSSPTKAVRGDVMDLPAINCPNFAIRNNAFTDIRPRGLRVMASDGVIEGNTIERTTGPGISLGGHYGYWREAGWVNDVIIRNNTLRDIGLGVPMQIADITAPGAICVWAETKRDAPPDVPFAAGNRNVRIIDNTIQGCSVNGITISGLTGGEVTGNRLSGTNAIEEKEAPGARRVPQTHAIVIAHSSDVSVDGNDVSSPGPFSQGNVLMGEASK